MSVAGSKRNSSLDSPSYITGCLNSCRVCQICLQDWSNISGHRHIQNTTYTAMSNPLLGDNGHDCGAPTDATNFENIRHSNEASGLLVQK